MAVDNISGVIEKQARYLAGENRRSDPDIQQVLWFPHDQEVRLVEISAQALSSPDDELHPFYFRAAPKHGLPAPSAVAMIRGEEFRRLRLPSGWGDWADAIEL